MDFQSLATTHFPDLRFAPVHDITIEAIRFSIPHNWEHLIFMLYDAHEDDLPGIKIFPHARMAWFPAIPGAVIAVHDCSVYLEPQVNLPHPYHQAVYAPDVTLAGYGEGTGLVDFLHQKALFWVSRGGRWRYLGVGGEGTSLVYFRLPDP